MYRLPAAFRPVARYARHAHTARSEAVIRMPHALTKQLSEASGTEGVEEIMSAKGPIFSTSVVGGTMAAKRAAEFVPLHTPTGLLENCTFDIRLNGDLTEVLVDCTATVNTGNADVESLTGATAAALTIYDMCKSVSKEGLLISKIALAADGASEAAKGGAPKAEAAAPERQQEPLRSRAPKDDAPRQRNEDAPPARGAKRESASKSEVKDRLGQLIEQIQREEAEARRNSSK